MKGVIEAMGAIGLAVTEAGARHGAKTFPTAAKLRATLFWHCSSMTACAIAVTAKIFSIRSSIMRERGLDRTHVTLRFARLISQAATPSAENSSSRKTRNAVDLTIDQNSPRAFRVGILSRTGWIG